jgi:hypothetical protein
LRLRTVRPVRALTARSPSLDTLRQPARASMVSAVRLLTAAAGGVSSTEEQARVERVVRGRGGGVLHRAVLAVGRRRAQEELQQVMTVHDSE